MDNVSAKQAEQANLSNSTKFKSLEVATVLPAGLVRTVRGMRDGERFEDGVGLKWKACLPGPARRPAGGNGRHFCLEVLAGAFSQRHERRLEINFLFLE